MKNDIKGVYLNGFNVVFNNKVNEPPIHCVLIKLINQKMSCLFDNDTHMNFFQLT